MDVELPNGTVITDVPDGTTQAELVRRLSATGHDTSWYRGSLKQSDPSEYDPSSQEYQAKYGATSGMSRGQKFAAGAGQAAVSTGRGLRQINQSIGDVVMRAQGMPLPSADAALRAQETENQRLDAPLLSDPYGLAGNVAGNVGMAYAGGSLLRAVPATQALGQGIINPQTIKGAAALGAGMGALRPVAEGESRTQNALVGGAVAGATQGAAKLLGKIARPVQGKLSVPEKRAVDTLESNGVKLDAAQKSGSTFLKRAKAALSDNPITAGGQVAEAQAQKTSFTRAVLEKAFGVTSDSADDVTMASVKDRAGKLFDSALDGTSIRMSGAGKTKLGLLVARSKRLLGDGNPIEKTADAIADQAKAGQIDGKFYQMIRQDLAAMQAQPNVSPLASEMIEGLDDAFQQAAGSAKAKQFQEARRLWRNMKLVERAIDTEGKGEISAPKLANLFGQGRNRNVGVYGKGDKSIVELMRLAKAGKLILPEKLPNSGTPARLLTNLAVPAGIGAGVGYAKEGDLGGAMAWGLGGAALPYLLQRGINSPGGANYLASGMNPGAVRNALFAIGQGGRLAPAALTSGVLAAQ